MLDSANLLQAPTTKHNNKHLLRTAPEPRNRLFIRSGQEHACIHGETLGLSILETSSEAMLRPVPLK